MGSISPLALVPQFTSAIANAAPLAASAGNALASLRDTEMLDLPDTAASVNQLQSLASSSSGSTAALLTGSAAPTLPPQQLQPPTSEAPLKQDYFGDLDPSDAAS